MNTETHTPDDQNDGVQAETDATETPDMASDTTGKVDEVIAQQEDTQTLRIAELTQALEAAEAQVLRTVAEAENTRKRDAREMAKAKKYAVFQVINDLIPMLDGLALGAQDTTDNADALREGMQMTLTLFTQTLHTHGLVVIAPEAGSDFDPEQHEAVAVAPSDTHAAGTIANVVQTGYALHDRILRPARVVVAEESEESEKVSDTGETQSADS